MQILQIDIGTLGFLVNGVLDFAVGFITGTDVEQFKMFLDLPFVRTGDPRRRIDHGAGPDLGFLAVEIAHRGMPCNHVITGLNRMPVQLLVGAGLVSGAPQTHAVGFIDFRPADQPLIGLAVGNAAAPRIVSLIEHLQC